MLSDFIFVLNGVTPIFIVIIIGYFLKSIHFVTEDFVKVADKLVFKLLLPVYLFNNVSSMKKDDFSFGDIKVAGYAMLAVLVISFGTLLLSGFFIKDSGAKGAFTQGVYRSNTAILGIPFAANLFGDDGARITAILIAFVVPLYNVVAVTILSMCDPLKNENGTKLSKKICTVAKDVAKNPLIIAILLGLAVCFAEIDLPIIADKTVAYLANASTPLALIAIGANFSFGDMKGRALLAIIASVGKTIIVPILVVGGGILLGFENAQLGALFVIFGTPAAVSSYIMAKNMNNDYKLASQILIFTTLMSAFTVALGSFLLFSSGLVAR
jgi:predicted permease